MGLGVSLLLLSILFVGVRAIAGLEVSYGAFEKDMGPQGHKKAQ
jgi:Na+-transporting methylmalonyl-CoA/oxaloacetate decarboxylase gamma subunit